MRFQAVSACCHRIDQILGEVLNCHRTGCHCHRVAIERARVEHAQVPWVEDRHHLGRSPDGADGEAATDQLPEQREIRPLH